MINASLLKPVEGKKYALRGESAANITLSSLRDTLIDINRETYGMPLEILLDTIKSGNLLRSTTEDCVKIINTEHRGEYFVYIITMRKQGRMAFIDLHYTGISKWTGRANDVDRRKKEGGLGGFLMNAAFGVNEKEYAAEYDYYDMLEHLFEDVFE